MVQTLKGTLESRTDIQLVLNKRAGPVVHGCYPFQLIDVFVANILSIHILKISEPSNHLDVALYTEQQRWPSGKEFSCNAGAAAEVHLIPELGRSP